MYNANNYGYNPYGRYMPQQPMQTADIMQSPVMSGNRPVLNGKVVESASIVSNIEIPLDGSVSYFPTASGDVIVTKQLQMDGTSKTQIYKLTEDGESKSPSYITNEDLTKAIKEIDLSEIDDIKEEIKDIKKTLKELKKKGE